MVVAWLAGFAASTDALHLTAPDREGRGLARAVRAAREEARAADLALVSAHGTATPTAATSPIASPTVQRRRRSVRRGRLARRRRRREPLRDFESCGRSTRTGTRAV